MRPIKTDFKTWPRRRNGEPIFNMTEDALLYAQLASKRSGTVDLMKAYRENAHRDLRHLRKARNPNLDRMFIYAVKGQFFQECLMEILRIQDEEGKR